MTRSDSKAPISKWLLVGAACLLVGAGNALAQTHPLESKLADAIDVLGHFTSDDDHAIPADLLGRAHGIAVIPDLFRGGFIFGGRRGKGVLVVRDDDGRWSNPAFITLTGGSVGWQIGAESVDLVLVFANDRSVRNIETGKFTLGGDASAVAGPLGRHNTAALTFRAEIYAYLRSRGLFAGAAFEGARLGLDRDANATFYASAQLTALGRQSAATPSAARRFLLRVEQATSSGPASPEPLPAAEEALTFPLERKN